MWSLLVPLSVRCERRCGEVLRMRSEGLQAKEALCTQPMILTEAWQAEYGILSRRGSANPSDETERTASRTEASRSGLA